MLGFLVRYPPEPLDLENIELAGFLVLIEDSTAEELRLPLELVDAIVVALVRSSSLFKASISYYIFLFSRSSFFTL